MVEFDTWCKGVVNTKVPKIIKVLEDYRRGKHSK
jgi:hypothetical protein